MKSATIRRWSGAVLGLALGAGMLTACSSDASTGGGGDAAPVDASSCTNTIVNADAPLVSVWAWYPAFEAVVDEFNSTHDDVQVCWTNAGQGQEEYTKFSTTIEAGSGAPDVVMLETDQINSFALRDALVDLNGFGAADIEDDYTAGAWADVSAGDGVYAVPVDGGPMGLLYRQDILDQYGIAVPTTWDEFAAAAQQLKDAGAPGVLTNFPTNRDGAAFVQALLNQAGVEPFDYDLGESPTGLGVDIDTPDEVKVLTYWNDLVSKKLVANDDAFTPDANTKLVDGSYAMYVAAAWGPGYLQGLQGGSEGAQWRAAPLPQWDASDPKQVNWGGSAFAVTSQARDQELAAEVAKGIFGTEAAWKIGIEQGALFPLWKPILESDYFKDLEYPFFGGQQINSDVFLAAASGYEGFTYSPVQNYFYDQQAEQTASMARGEITPEEAATSIQDAVDSYATEQGFELK